MIEQPSRLHAAAVCSIDAVGGTAAFLSRNGFLSIAYTGVGDYLLTLDQELANNNSTEQLVRRLVGAPSADLYRITRPSSATLQILAEDAQGAPVDLGDFSVAVFAYAEGG